MTNVGSKSVRLRMRFGFIKGKVCKVEPSRNLRGDLASADVWVAAEEQLPFFEREPPN